MNIIIEFVIKMLFKQECLKMFLKHILIEELFLLCAGVALLTVLITIYILVCMSPQGVYVYLTSH